jgi:hypothetical protein
MTLTDGQNYSAYMLSYLDSVKQVE